MALKLYLHEQAVSLAVVLVRRVEVPLELVEEPGLELVPHEQIQVCRLVQVVAVRLDSTNLLKKSRLIRDLNSLTN